MKSVVVVGTGAFATNLCRGLARPPARPTEVHVLGRRAEAVAATCAAGRAVADSAGTPVSFRRWDGSRQPDLVAVCASHQSPQEFRTDDTEWARLVRSVGFAVTTPLQAVLADQIATEFSGVPLVNACYPDLVNPLLRARGHAVLCGVGNAHTLATAIAARLGITDEARLKVLAHHAHLHAPADPVLEVRCWVDDRPRSDVAALLRTARSAPRDRLNAFGALAAGGVVRSMLDDGHYVGTLPGALGVPGGHPVEIAAGRVTLRPIPDVADAVEWLRRTSLLDGGWVDDDGDLWLTRRAADELRRYWPDLPSHLPADALHEIVRRLLSLRDHLRRSRPVPAPS